MKFCCRCFHSKKVLILFLPVFIWEKDFREKNEEKSYKQFQPRYSNAFFLYFLVQLFFIYYLWYLFVKQRDRKNRVSKRKKGWRKIAGEIEIRHLWQWMMGDGWWVKTTNNNTFILCISIVFQQIINNFYYNFSLLFSYCCFESSAARFMITFHFILDIIFDCSLFFPLTPAG